MIVILNNGIRIYVPKEAVQDICQKLMKGDATQWQCQISTATNEITSIVNLKEMAAICHSDDILPQVAGILQEIGLFIDSLPVDDTHGRYWAEKFRRFVLDKKSTR